MAIRAPNNKGIPLIHYERLKNIPQFKDVGLVLWVCIKGRQDVRVNTLVLVDVSYWTGLCASREARVHAALLRPHTSTLVLGGSKRAEGIVEAITEY